MFKRRLTQLSLRTRRTQTFFYCSTGPHTYNFRTRVSCNIFNAKGTLKYNLRSKGMALCAVPSTRHNQSLTKQYNFFTNILFLEQEYSIGKDTGINRRPEVSEKKKKTVPKHSLSVFLKIREFHFNRSSPNHRHRYGSHYQT